LLSSSDDHSRLAHSNKQKRADETKGTVEKKKKTKLFYHQRRTAFVSPVREITEEKESRRSSIVIQRQGN
jgi:hypothetical protein